MPPLTQEELWAMLNFQVPNGVPSLDPTTAFTLGGIAPPMDKYGNLDVNDVDAQSKMLNQYQNVLSSFADPANAAVSGLGSWGGVGAGVGGGIAGGGGLDPITTESVIDTPQTNYLNYLRNQQGVEGVFATRILGGEAPSLILADMQAKIEDPAGAGVDPAQASQLAAGLPKMDAIDDVTGKPNGQKVVDWEATRTMLEKMATPYFQEQGGLMGPNITTNSYGQPVALSEKPSPTMEWFQKQGLTDPRTQYGVDFALQNSPELQMLMGDVSSKGQAYQEAQDAYKKFLKEDPQRAAILKQVQGMAQGRQDKYKSDLDTYQRKVFDQARMAALPQPLEPIVQPPPPLKEAQEAGPPGWLGAVGNAVSGAVTGIPGNINDAIARVAGKPMARPGSGGLTSPTNVNIFSEQEQRAPQGLQRPTLQQASMLEQILGRVQQAPFDASYDLSNKAYRNQQAMGKSMRQFAAQIAPMYGAAKAGRTPFQDQIQQRLQTLYATGALNR